jgi:ATP-dependent helicase HrpA
MLTDRRALLRQLKKIQQRMRDNKPVDRMVTELTAQLDASVSRVEQRRAAVPPIDFPEELPVSQKKDAILQALGEHQVIILCGETGSGKTTQLPKICLQMGLGARGLIGHTQPRRLAASSVASRIAEELHSELGQLVGYKVRFTDKLGSGSQIKLMTDGILLAEIHHDPQLDQYDTIIIDEAHERSLNIDFLLGYLKRLLPRRPDLKIIITSATIDPQRFSRHFSDAPIIEVSGRTYPVEVRYHPLHGEDDDARQKDLQQGIGDAVDELNRLDRGDILVFLSGERDIRDTASYLHKRQLPNTEILPLLARLSASEQQRIFHGSSQRRIVLATNIAETSLTVPGIKYVIDSGLARISRYSWRSKMQRLPIEKISQASANQRKGRCGRVSSGVCIRLYSEDDFNQRAEFTEPEIQRTNLASVILQMENMQLGHVEDFPFVEPPDQRLVKDGYNLLFELGAIDHQHKITATGKKLARLPIDPRLGRMLLEAEREAVLPELLVICSALAIQDPRERPMDRQQAADEAHKTFHDERSDFLAYLNIWKRYHQQQKKLSGNRLRQWCKQHFLSWVRIREWRDSHRQIRQMLEQLGIRCPQQSHQDDSDDRYDYRGIHCALLSGLLGNLGYRDDEKGYLGSRNRRFNLFPGSALFSKNPKWIMAAEIVETSRVYARGLAKIDVRWIEQKAEHLLKRSYSEVHWEKKPAQVCALERSSLYGLIINPARKVNYGPINPGEARETFIRAALVAGDFNCNAAFFRHNRALIDELENLEAKSRRQDILVDDENLFQFYHARVPAGIYSGPQFMQWLKSLPTAEQKTLLLSREDLMQHDAADITDRDFPDQLEINHTGYPLEYHFDPRHQRDGITLVTPLAGLQGINAQRCEWLVPGMLREKMTALIRSLPKPLRRHFVPAPNFADACFDALQPGDLPLASAMSAQLKKMTGTEIPYDAWRPELLDAHLLMNFRVIGNDGKILAQGRNLQQLKDQFVDHRDDSTASAQPPSIEQDEVDAGILDDLPESIETETQGVRLKAFPALQQEGRKVALRCFNTRQEALASHRSGLRQLFSNALPEQLRHLKSHLPNIQQLCLQYRPLGTCEDLKQQLVAVTLDRLFSSQPVHSAADFNRLLEQGRSQLLDTAGEYCRLLADILQEYAAIKKILRKPPLDWLDILADIQEQLNQLLQPRFLVDTELQWLQQYPRYLKAIIKRLDKVRDNPERERKHRLAFNGLWQEYLKRAHSLQQQHLHSDQLAHYRWMLEEYRVSLFAQELKTLFPVSEKRLKSYWNAIDDI